MLGVRAQSYGTPAFPLRCLGGTRPGEEVRDGPHSDNRGSGNRCGVAPTAAPLRSQAGLYNALGRAFLDSLLGAAFALPGCALRGTSGGATMPVEALVGSGCPILPGRGSSYVHTWAGLYIRQTRV